ncbi:MAG: protein-L-isoaspartate(D-aspartate) O-methyltransferase [Chloroflexota bacterium]|nr:protein-L-isoaspartate(D-aspartate) O-methyltransferase [Chloroflexota bacterium]
MRELWDLGIRDERVRTAMATVPRDRFVPEELSALAWTNDAVPIGLDQTISQPYVVALMTEALALAGTERVLEIGTGSGYQTAILASLAMQVTSIERHPELALAAKRLLDELGYRNVHVHVGDGTIGYPPDAPYDRIIVTAAAPRLPEPLQAQLSAENGRIVIPIGEPQDQRLVMIERRGDRLTEHPLGRVRFVPLIGRAGWRTSRPDAERGPSEPGPNNAPSG